MAGTEGPPPLSERLKRDSLRYCPLRTDKKGFTIMSCFKEKKVYSRSIRMTQTVKDYVEAQSGVGFNEKFENMVLYCMEREASLGKRIKDSECTLVGLTEKVIEAERMVRSLSSVQFNLSSAIRSVETWINDVNKVTSSSAL